MKKTRAVVFELSLSLLGLLGFFGLDRGYRAFAAGTNAYELKLPDNALVERLDFEQKGIEGWKTVDGQWTLEKIPESPSGNKVLVQRAVQNRFNVIVTPGGPYTDVDV